MLSPAADMWIVRRRPIGHLLRRFRLFRVAQGRIAEGRVVVHIGLGGYLRVGV